MSLGVPGIRNTISVIQFSFFVLRRNDTDSICFLEKNNSSTFTPNFRANRTRYIRRSASRRPQYRPFDRAECDARGDFERFLPGSPPRPPAIRPCPRTGRAHGYRRFRPPHGRRPVHYQIEHGTPIQKYAPTASAISAAITPKAIRWPPLFDLSSPVAMLHPRFFWK